jgi:hypothetical protein
MSRYRNVKVMDPNAPEPETEEPVKEAPEAEPAVTE